MPRARRYTFVVLLGVAVALAVSHSFSAAADDAPSLSMTVRLTSEEGVVQAFSVGWEAARGLEAFTGDLPTLSVRGDKDRFGNTIGLDVDIRAGANVPKEFRKNLKGSVNFALALAYTDALGANDSTTAHGSEKADGGGSYSAKWEWEPLFSGKDRVCGAGSNWGNVTLAPRVDVSTSRADVYGWAETSVTVQTYCSDHEVETYLTIQPLTASASGRELAFRPYAIQEAP